METDSTKARHIDKALDAPRHPPGAGSRLTPAQRREIQELALVEGLSQAEIARHVGRNRETIANVLKAADTQQLREQLLADLSEEAKATLHAGVGLAAREWRRAIPVAAERGDHKPARDLLLHTGVIEPVGDARDRFMANVQVMIGMPGAPLPEPDDLVELVVPPVVKSIEKS